MSVCSDPCMLAEDDRGVLRVRVAGDPDSSEWPYSCTMAGSNNLRRDPTTGCIWVDPPTKNSLTAVQGDFFPGVSLSGGATNTVTGVCNLTITNPDPCRSATALITVQMGWTFDADFDPSGSPNYGGFICSRQLSGSGLPADGGFVEMWRNHLGTRTTAEVRCRTVQYIPTIAPSGTATVNLDMRAQNFQGAMIISRMQGKITALVTSI